jgi:hypothetical protein
MPTPSTITAGVFLRHDGWWRLVRDRANGIYSIVKVYSDSSEQPQVEIIDRGAALTYFNQIRPEDRAPDSRHLFDEPPEGEQSRPMGASPRRARG